MEQVLKPHAKMNAAPGFALMSKGNLNLFLNEPGAGGAGQEMPDGTEPKAGGWMNDNG